MVSTMMLRSMQALSAWREQQAQKRNIPRNWVLKEPVLLELAQKQPSSLAALERIEGVSLGLVRHNGQTLLQLMAEVQGRAAQALPQPLPEPLPLEATRALKRLKKVGEQFALEHQIAPELVLKKKILVDALASGWPQGPYQLPQSLQGWRREYLGQALQTALAGEIA